MTETDEADPDGMALLLALARRLPPLVQMQVSARDGEWTLSLWLPTDRDHGAWQWHGADLGALLRNADVTWPFVRTNVGTLLDAADRLHAQPEAEVSEFLGLDARPARPGVD
jgi:hypothetical protein